MYISGDRQWEPCDHRSIYWMGPNDARTNFPYLRPSAPKIENMYEKKLLGRNRYRIAWNKEDGLDPIEKKETKKERK